jgi:hypothetical protein
MNRTSVLIKAVDRTIEALLLFHSFCHVRTWCLDSLENTSFRAHLGSRDRNLSRHGTCWWLGLKLLSHKNYEK